MSGRAVPTRGFTMAEVLATLFVIIICSSAVIAVFFTGTRDAISASDRNAAGLLYSEAQREIEKDHLLTPEMATTLGIDPIQYGGTLVATVASDPESENNSTAPYQDVFFYGAEKLNDGIFTLKSCREAVGSDVAVWPPPSATPRNIGGGYYRVRYTLEKHPDWVAAFGNSTTEELCPMRGVYVLTMICYSDNHQDMSSLVQVAQPVVVYLHDRKAR